MSGTASLSRPTPSLSLRQITLIERLEEIRPWTELTFQYTDPERRLPNGSQPHCRPAILDNNDILASEGRVDKFGQMGPRRVDREFLGHLASVAQTSCHILKHQNLLPAPIPELFFVDRGHSLKL